MRIKLSFLLLFFIAFLFSFFLPQTALADTSTLSGNVSDSSSADIDGASITVTDSGNNSTVGNTTTDSSGNYSIIVPGGTYNVQVTPPAGSNFSPAIALNQTISSNTVLNFFLTPAGTVVLSGHVYDPLGNSLSGQTVSLQASGGNPITTTTDNNGNYSLQVSSGTYTLDVRADSNSLSLKVPQLYWIQLSNYSLTQSTMLDITLPTKKIDFHVQDANGNPVNNVGLKTFVEGSVFNESQLSIGGGITNARGRLMAYGTYNPEPTTDASGNVTLWLFPNSSGKSYTITATPPGGNNNVTTTTVPNLVVAGDAQQTITMQQPVTLSGHVYGPQGNPLTNQTVYLQTSGGAKTTATTDSSGNYSLEVAPGTYILDISSYDGAANHPPINAPQYYELKKSNYSLTQNTTLDIIIPAKKVDIHIQDPQGNAIGNAAIQATHPCGWGCLANVDGLSIGGGIIDARGESLYGYIDPSPTTDSSGDVTLWLLPNNSDKSYNFIATPPNGTNFTATTLSNIVVTSDTQQTITMQQPVTLSGHVYGPLGNALPSQTVSLGTTTTTTDANGNYSLQVSTGTYVLKIESQNNAFSLNVPQYYELQVNSYSLIQDTTLDITVPANRVNVHVQDVNGNPVSNVSLQTGLGLLANVDGLSIGGGITNARGKVVYGTYNTSPATDASGDVTLWLFPNNFDKSYDIAANPPSGSIYNQFTLNDVVVTGDQNELISLQYNHDTPVTISDLATQNPDDTYSNPTTITLSATSAPGYTIANTYYTVDEGTQQTYSSPFTVSGTGEHTITYWSTDHSRVQESHNSKTFTITSPTPQLTSLNPAKIWIGLKNSNDIGIKFDLKAEVYKNNTLISSGQLNSVPGGSNGFAHARLNTIPFNTFSPIDFPSDSQLSLKLYVRNACIGSGKNSGTARLWYNDSQANSRFNATIASNTSDYFLLNNFALGIAVGTGPKQTSDITAGAKCSPFKSFGTWTITL